ncbi:hypothetical protein N7481_001604 [Penicillium waksmanii]|uniref:uncharacterized protein n=1 Tax=Penicillium waksmanii TaxID=69791 RepID=UPI002548DE5C|nr:uncharacterized protein N7481_001604 [Penicillium waksmanii]KAJ6001195.1 hypothetical protein N7481_001604 [Penicillium waksmanii]
MEHPHPQTENFNHTYLHENPSEESGNRRESLEEARNECGKTCFDRQNSLPEVRPSIVSPSNDREKLAENESLTRRPAPLIPEAEILEGQSNPGIEISERRGSAGPFDGNNERVAALTEPKKNASLTLQGDTTPENRRPETIARNTSTALSSPSPTEPLQHNEEEVYQGPVGFNLTDRIPSSVTCLQDAPATSIVSEGNDALVPEASIEVQIINRPQPSK